jgi:hypothetical protein
MQTMPCLKVSANTAQDAINAAAAAAAAELVRNAVLANERLRATGKSVSRENQGAVRLVQRPRYQTDRQPIEGVRRA